ncbi:MAG: hypothetical protein J7J99_06530 [Thermoprotei archaeon]|nr:hypothetical protein [Thermoprotei archaeon]
MATIILPIGHYIRRVIRGVKYWCSRIPIERIYLIYDRRRNALASLSQINVEHIEKLISSALYDVFRIPVNMGAYEEVFSTLYLIARYEVQVMKNEEILIDVTNTNVKVVSAAISLAHLFPSIKAYIVPSRNDIIVDLDISVREFYDQLDQYAEDPYEIPIPRVGTFEISFEEERVLLTLLMHGGRAGSIKSLIAWSDEDPLDPAIKNKFSRLIKRLFEKRLVEIEVRAKTKAIKLTDFGKALALGIRKFNKLKDRGYDLSQLGFYLKKEYLLPT